VLVVSHVVSLVLDVGVSMLRLFLRYATIIESNSRQVEIEKFDTSMMLLDQSPSASSAPPLPTKKHYSPSQ
jgi:hypothetical protein